MTCPEFQARFSDYYDGTGEPAFMTEASSHLDGCAECRRYRDVVEQGIQILKAVPTPSVSDDFLPRLQHRIYHLEDGPALGQSETAGSATTATTALAIAMLIALAAWSPALVQSPEVDLPPIVVNRPAARVLGVRPPVLWAGNAEVTFAPSIPAVHQGLWDDPRLFTRYSPLTATEVRRHPVMRRADLD